MAAFDRLQARVNSVSIKKLSNAIALIDGEEIAGEFNDGHAQVLESVSGTNPTFRCLMTDVQADPRGLVLTIRSVNYEVNEFRPDGNGMIFLDLEKA